MNLVESSRYSDEVLNYCLGQPEKDATVCAPVSQRIEDRLIKTALRQPVANIVLAGVGCGRIVERLVRELPSTVSLVVVEWVMDAARQARHDFPERSFYLVADTSAMALFCLLRQSGLTPENTLFLNNPEIATRVQSETGATLRQLFFKTQPVAVHSSDESRTLTTAAILRPGEPDLSGFATALPDYAHQTVLVWDALDVPVEEGALFSHLRGITQRARPLNADFAAQRNAMLELCQSEMVFSLDADERMSPALQQILPTLVGMDFDLIYFQRVTLYPDTHHTKIGFGLWPDLQPRLFRRYPGIRYIRPIHERLEGTGSRVGLLLGAPIIHLQGILKDHCTLADKLRVFDAAASYGIKHHLSDEYPYVPLTSLVLSSPELVLLP
ncbi:hypothetical protein [Desulfovibrio inopinatus]|uniref:hypothetical protein n=1 Tax=Desulfovibrio inopinatus TaxID=102109 RepID=UPI000427C849|nr:hypothetical protein [Desulfovibrio inopinatus]